MHPGEKLGENTYCYKRSNLFLNEMVGKTLDRVFFLQWRQTILIFANRQLVARDLSGQSQKGIVWKSQKFP